MKIQNKFTYAIHYCYDLTDSYNDSEFCGEVFSLKEALNTIKEVWENNEPHGKYYVSGYKNDMFYPMYVCYCKNNKIELDLV